MTAVGRGYKIRAFVYAQPQSYETRLRCDPRGTEVEVPGPCLSEVGAGWHLTDAGDAIMVIVRAVASRRGCCWRYAGVLGPGFLPGAWPAVHLPSAYPWACSQVRLWYRGISGGESIMSKHLSRMVEAAGVQGLSRDFSVALKGGENDMRAFSRTRVLPC